MTSPDYRTLAETEVAGIIRERQPLPVETLVSEDARRLSDALTDERPLPQSQAEECRQLLNQIAAHRPARRITIDDHARWQETGRPPHEDDNDIAELIQDLRSVRREGA